MCTSLCDHKKSFIIFCMSTALEIAGVCCCSSFMGHIMSLCLSVCIDVLSLSKAHHAIGKKSGVCGVPSGLSRASTETLLAMFTFVYILYAVCKLLAPHRLALHFPCLIPIGFVAIDRPSYYGMAREPGSWSEVLGLEPGALENAFVVGLRCVFRRHHTVPCDCFVCVSVSLCC